VPPLAEALVAARPVAVRVAATARTDTSFVRVLMVVSKVRSQGASPITREP